MIFSKTLSCDITREAICLSQGLMYELHDWVTEMNGTEYLSLSFYIDCKNRNMFER